MSAVDWEPIWLTLKLAAVTTSILLAIGIPMAWVLANAISRWRMPLHALLNMPLVLPPSVLGFYLLVAFSQENAFGRFLAQGLHLPLAFTFGGLVVGSVIFSLPFMVNPLLAGFDAIPRHLTEAAYLLGKSRWTTLLRVALPNMRPALLTGIALTFAHTMGEFGVVLMIGGKIPGTTKVASIAIFDEVESLRFGSAHIHALILFAISFAILLALFAINRKGLKAF
ncbi:MAG: molybdate ABC transporter permease subunit [Fibrobacteria bacterium]